jgi:hypothetical protein
MTLTEFLLARIAEDEAAAREANKVGDRRGVEVGGEVWACQSQGWHVGVSPARVLAECEAKRLIFGATWNLESFDFTTDAYRHIVGKQREIMHALALPYADHPDYRDEWRP